jgi:hypothetical protein
MDTIVIKEIKGKKYNQYNQEIIPCKICGEGTTALGTGLCDRCWELNTRIRSNFEIAIKIISMIKFEEFSRTHNQDVYKKVTAKILNKPIDKVTKEERKVTKKAVYLNIYKEVNKIYD